MSSISGCIDPWSSVVSGLHQCNQRLIGVENVKTPIESSSLGSSSGYFLSCAMCELPNGFDKCSLKPFCTFPWRYPSRDK